jgi:hypothetical protein
MPEVSVTGSASMSALSSTTALSPVAPPPRSTAVIEVRADPVETFKGNPSSAARTLA